MKRLAALVLCAMMVFSMFVTSICAVRYVSPEHGGFTPPGPVVPIDPIDPVIPPAEEEEPEPVKPEPPVEEEEPEPVKPSSPQTGYTVGIVGLTAAAVACGAVAVVSGKKAMKR